MKPTEVVSEQGVSSGKKSAEKAPRRTLSVEQAGDELGISRASAYAYARKGFLPTIRLGNRLLVLRGPFDRMLGEA
jgi:Helix-turn-helix domain